MSRETNARIDVAVEKAVLFFRSRVLLKQPHVLLVVMMGGLTPDAVGIIR